MRQQLFILFIIFSAIAQESWEIYYTSFQSNNPKDAEGWIVANNYNDIIFTNCGGFTLFGGYNSFGYNTIVSKYFKLPPHYRVKITLEFWKIDTWDNEFGYIIIDEGYWLQAFNLAQGSPRCGLGNNWNEYPQTITIEMEHYLESLIFIATSNVNEIPYYESWGFRDFTMSILKCPQGCVYCYDNNINNCYFWISHLSLWHESIAVDGWMKNDNIQAGTSKCVSFNLIGGYLNLAPNDKLEKIINLIPHYRIRLQFQLWKIDPWNNEIFSLGVDDYIYSQTILGTIGIYSICGSNGLDQIFNIGIDILHYQPQCKITFKTHINSITTNAYWGIRAFNLYLAKCVNGCDRCLGPLKTQCIVCSSGWVFYNNLCTYPPPMYLQKIQITYLKNPNSDNKIPVEINLLEVNKQIVTQGNTTLSFNTNKSILTIQVQIKCETNKIIIGQFQSSLVNDLQQYNIKHKCQEAFNSIIYSVKFQLSNEITQQQFINNLSDTKCLIYQVLQVIDEFIPLKILEIFFESI